MADISQLTMTFVDGTTVIDANMMNSIVSKINELVVFANGGVTPSVVATPSITINNGVVTISCATSGATIRYTTDGSTPSSSSGTVYSAAFTPASGTTQIKAIAYKSGMTDSQVATASYTEQATDITSLFSSWESGAVVETSGSETTSTTYVRCGYVDISAYQGKLLKYTNIKTEASPGGTFGLAFYDASQVYISSGNKAIHVSASETGYEDADVFIPTNAKYVRLTWWSNSGTGASYHSSFHAEVSNAQITDLTSQVSSWTDGKYLKYSDGTETTKSACKYSNNYIDISSYVGKALNFSHIKRADTNWSAGVCFYDSSQNYLSGQRNIVNAAEAGWQDATVAIPTNAKYVRLDWYSENGDGSTWASDFYVKVITNLTM